MKDKVEYNEKRSEREITNKYEGKERDGEFVKTFKGKVGRLISRLDSNEQIEMESSTEPRTEFPKKKSVLSKIAMFESLECETPAKAKRKPKPLRLVTKDVQPEVKAHVHVHTPLIVNEIFKPFYDKHKLITNIETLNESEIERHLIEEDKEIYGGTNIIKDIINEQISAEEINLNNDISAALQKPYNFETHKDIDTLEEDRIAYTPKDKTENFKYKNTEPNTPIGDAPVIIPKVRPVREILSQFEPQYKNIDNDEVFHKGTFRSKVKEALDELKQADILVKRIQQVKNDVYEEKTEQNTQTKKTNPDFNQEIAKIEDLQDFTEKFDLKSIKRNDSIIKTKVLDTRRTTSVADLYPGQSKGKVSNMIVRMRSYDIMELDKKEKQINIKEMPRKRSVSEKIALFERKLTPINADPNTSTIANPTRPNFTTTINPTHRSTTTHIYPTHPSPSTPFNPTDRSPTTHINPTYPSPATTINPTDPNPTTTIDSTEPDLTTFNPTYPDTTTTFDPIDPTTTYNPTDSNPTTTFNPIHLSTITPINLTHPSTTTPAIPTEPSITTPAIPTEPSTTTPVNLTHVSTTTPNNPTHPNPTTPINPTNSTITTTTTPIPTTTTTLKPDPIQEKLRELSTKYPVIEIPTVELSNGLKMPVIAVGTANLEPVLTKAIISSAIDMGYRAIDTAYIYGNEKAVGEAVQDKIQDGTVKREDLFIISKLWSTFHREDLVETACNNSLNAMGLDYFDLYLIHNPMSFKEGPNPLPKIATVLQYSTNDYMNAWYGMEPLITKGLVKGIGVSNFNSTQVARVMEKGRVKPVVNQVECHPYLSQEKLDDFCAQRNITLSCFGVLGSKGTPPAYRGTPATVIDDPLVKVMATALHITPAQLLIAYQLKSERTVVVKSSSAAHLWDNLQALSVNLTDAEMSGLRLMHRNKRIFTFAGMGDTHKNYPFNTVF